MAGLMFRPRSVCPEKSDRQRMPCTWEFMLVLAMSFGLFLRKKTNILRGLLTRWNRKDPGREGEACWSRKLGPYLQAGMGRPPACRPASVLERARLELNRELWRLGGPVCASLGFGGLWEPAC